MGGERDGIPTWSRYLRMALGSESAAITETGLTTGLFGVCLRQTPLGRRRHHILKNPRQGASPFRTMTALGRLRGGLVTAAAHRRFGQ